MTSAVKFIFSKDSSLTQWPTFIFNLDLETELSGLFSRPGRLVINLIAIDAFGNYRLPESRVKLMAFGSLGGHEKFSAHFPDDSSLSINLSHHCVRHFV